MDLATARGRALAARGLNAFISLSRENGPGPAVAVKDLIDVQGMVTTGGGRFLPDVPAARDADCVAQFRRSGAGVVGKTNLHEWALGPTSANPHYGRVRNPRDPSRVPGGSSGGSAAAVAAELCDWAVGTDTGGSIRMPAGLCGVVGMKPTYGTVSCQGVLALAPSLDTVGPLAPDVAQAGVALAMLSGRDEFASFPAVFAGEVSVATPRGWVTDLDEATAATWELLSRGLPEIEFPPRPGMTAAFGPIAGFESASLHRRWMAEHPERYGADVLQRLREGAEVGEADYRAALVAREEFRAEAAAALRGYDALLLPATACVAPRHEDPDRREPLTRFLRPFSVTGQPVVVVPYPTPGLPIGIQVVGHFGRDRDLLTIAAALERSWASSARD